MKKILSTIAITLAFFGTAKAIVVQKVILNNGSELSGYTKSTGTDGKLVFDTEQAIICLDGSEVKEIINEQVYQLYEVNAKWSECEQALEGEGDNRTVTLSDVVLTNGKTVQKVKVLERGVRVKYLEMASNSYILSWKDISAIKAKRRDKGLISGINRVYQTESGNTYEGQYAGETNSTLSLYLDNGVIQTLSVDDVVRYTYHKLNPNQPIFEQSELIDIVKTKDGNSVQGIIVEQNYTNNDEAFLVVEQENGNKKNILLSELNGIERKVNDNYKPKSDIVLNVGDVVINRGSTATYCNVNEDKDEVMTLEKPNLQVRVKAGVPFTVEYRVAKGTNEDIFQLVQTQKLTVKGEDYYCFTYKSLVNKLIRPGEPSETSVNQTTKLTYTAHKTGVYALYDAQAKRAIPIVVE